MRLEWNAMASLARSMADEDRPPSAVHRALIAVYVRRYDGNNRSDGLLQLPQSVMTVYADDAAGNVTMEILQPIETRIAADGREETFPRLHTCGDRAGCFTAYMETP